MTLLPTLINSSAGGETPEWLWCISWPICYGRLVILLFYCNRLTKNLLSFYQVCVNNFVPNRRNGGGLTYKVLTIYPLATAANA